MPRHARCRTACRGELFVESHDARGNTKLVQHTIDDPKGGLVDYDVATDAVTIRIADAHLKTPFWLSLTFPAAPLRMDVEDISRVWAFRHLNFQGRGNICGSDGRSLPPGTLLDGVEVKDFKPRGNDDVVTMRLKDSRLPGFVMDVVFSMAQLAKAVDDADSGSDSSSGGGILC